MNRKRLFAGLLCVDFAALTLWTIYRHGLNPISWMEQLGGSWLTACIVADLVLALGVAVAWMIADAKKTGRQVWGYVVLTCLTGSIGPLLYIALTPDAVGEHVHKYEQERLDMQSAV